VRLPRTPNPRRRAPQTPTSTRPSVQVPSFPGLEYIAAFDLTGLDAELPPTVVPQSVASDTIVVDFANRGIGTSEKQ
jgi:hypothetical protein